MQSEITRQTNLVFMVDPIGFGLEILGVFLGALAAFELDNLRDKWNEKNEAQRILEFIRGEIIDNVESLENNAKCFKQIQNPGEEIGPYALFPKHLRKEVWAGIVSKLDVIADIGLLLDLSRLWYEIDVFERDLLEYEKRHDEYIRYLTYHYPPTQEDDRLLEFLRTNEDSSVSYLIMKITRSYKIDSDCGLITLAKNVIEEITKQLDENLQPHKTDVAVVDLDITRFRKI